jgi:hypothetical protein
MCKVQKLAKASEVLHSGRRGLPQILLKWYLILGIYVLVIGIFLLLRLQGGNQPDLFHLLTEALLAKHCTRINFF